MKIQVIKNEISRDELKNIAHEQFGTLVKAVVDVKQEIMAIGGEHHEDEREFLIEHEGSKFDDIWGIDLYPERSGKDFVSFDSIINQRPSLHSRGISHPEVQKEIREIVERLVSKEDKEKVL